MRTVLVTGSNGQVGSPLLERLESSGWSVRSFDLASGQDLRDENAVLDAVEGCDTIVHAGAITHDSGGTPAEILATNLLGTWHVLLAGERSGVERVVYFSSGQVFGCAEGEGAPAYLPIDDEHPLRAARPYGMSKRLAEEMCAAWTSRTGVSSLVLRPVLILDDDQLTRTSESDVELGAFVHVDDVVDATIRSLEVNVSGHHRLTLCGAGPFDTTRARDLLGWQPQRRWHRTSSPSTAS